MHIDMRLAMLQAGIGVAVGGVLGALLGADGCAGGTSAPVRDSARFAAVSIEHVAAESTATIGGSVLILQDRVWSTDQCHAIYIYLRGQSAAYIGTIPCKE